MVCALGYTYVHAETLALVKKVIIANVSFCLHLLASGILLKLHRKNRWSCVASISYVRRRVSWMMWMYARLSQMGGREIHFTKMGAKTDRETTGVGRHGISFSLILNLSIFNYFSPYWCGSAHTYLVQFNGENECVWINLCRKLMFNLMFQYVIFCIAWKTINLILGEAVHQNP